jgi:outer membrane receptor protein involved in Fe transport
VTDQLKATVGVRFSRTEFEFNTYTGGPQLFNEPIANSGDKKENSFTPKINLAYQLDPSDLFYATYAKGFRPGGANNPVPQAACAADFQSFGIKESPATYDSDTVNSFEIGAKNNFANRLRIATSVYYVRWQNIQQTVVPPICQISFIANLGSAVAKGADIQGELEVTSALTADFTAGYTDARYTQDSKFSSSQATPVVSRGDAISGQSGQPNPPFTASAGLEYHFAAFGHESFARIDYEYQGRGKWLPPEQDPGTLQFDPANYMLSATNFVSLRAGMTFNNISVEPFIDNLTDTHVITNYNYSIDPGTGNSRLAREFTFRPRTYGVTFTWHQ